MSVKQYIIGLRHIGLVTHDLDGTVARLQQIFGLEDADISRIPPSGRDANSLLAFFSMGDSHYEVIEPISEELRSILLTTNQGTNHLCYNVTDLDAAVAAMAEMGIRLGHVTPDAIVELPHARMAYFHPADTAGVLLEFVQQR